mgnify:FL=1
MSSKIRECVKDLEKNQNVEILLPEYVSQYMEISESYAKMNLMMEYYMFYETVTEGINPYIDSAKETADAFHDIVAAFFEKKPSDSGKKELAESLLKLRQEVVDRMQVLTAYVDCFVIYEYILNRVQYRFEDQEFLPEDSVFAQELVNFIFSSQDQATISDNIRFALGQLPMRMARSRYFELLKDSISVYKGSDVSSLEGYLYMFRTSAMLYHDDNMEKYFQEFVPVLEELASLDYETIDEKTYQIYAEKIRVNASKLNDVSDLYMQLGKLINDMYIICAADEYVQNQDEMKTAENVIRGINALFQNRECDVFEQSESPLTTEEEKLYWMGEQFVEVEGKQESLYDRLNMAGAALEEIEESQKEEIAKLSLNGAFRILKKMFLMTSNSTFADLSEQTLEEKVSAQMAEEAADRLIAECKEFFKGKSRMLRRAVMANTLEKMPVFFTSAQEVADYVMNALTLCDDAAEKYAAKQLLSEIMH